MRTNSKVQGAPNSPVLVFSNSLGSDLSMWDELVPFLLPYFRIVQYDTRGHGGSETTAEPYSIELLGQDLLCLMDGLQVAEFHFCGLSMGGLIGQWLGVHHSERIEKLVLSNTAALIGTEASWNQRIKIVGQHGIGPVVESILECWFTEQYRNLKQDRLAEMESILLSNDPLGYCNCCAAIRDADFRESIKQIDCKTLVITGEEDPVTNVEHARFLAKCIPDARLTILPVRHLASVESPKEYAMTLIDFLVGETSLEKGMHVRRTVLGDTHVEKANANLSPFNTDFQKLITKYAWSEIWTRPGLSKYNRSLITLAMMIALNRKVEFEMHVKAAINNGVNILEIKEVILQSALYCGLPAANEAFQAAEAVFKELGIKY